MTPNVLVALNCSMSPAPQSIASLLQAQKIAKAGGVFSAIRMEKQSTTHYLMSQAFAQEVIESETYSHLMTVSDDIWCPENAILKLIQDDKDIVSGIYKRRGFNDQLCAILKDPSDLDHYVKKGGLAEVALCPGHTMTIKREVLEKVAEAFPELEFKMEGGKMVRGTFMPFIANKTLFLDDYGFSMRAVSCGFKCWIDFDVRLKHRSEIWDELQPIKK